MNAPGPPLLCSCSMASIRRSHDGIASSLHQLDGAAGNRRRVCGTVAPIASAGPSHGKKDKGANATVQCLSYKCSPPIKG